MISTGIVVDGVGKGGSEQVSLASTCGGLGSRTGKCVSVGKGREKSNSCVFGGDGAQSVVGSGNAVIFFPYLSCCTKTNGLFFDMVKDGKYALKTVLYYILIGSDF